MLFVLTPQKIENLMMMKEAGADAVVVSPSFYAARGANTISEKDLDAWKEACEKHQLAMFVQVNRFFCEEDLERLEAFLQRLKTLQVEGIIFGDEGVLQVAKKLQISDKMIYQPDTLITNHLDVDFYLSQGLHSVVLAKEITLEEIQLMAAKSDAKRMEVIIHGRLAMMHSKRTLLSNYFNFLQKDYNPKGKRNLFIMEETRDAHMPIMEDEQGTHVFSGFTQNAFHEIQAIQDSGIGYVRIDGIFQDDAYSIEALHIYKGILAGKLNPDEALNEYRSQYPQDAVEDGFYYTKTSKTK